MDLHHGLKLYCSLSLLNAYCSTDELLGIGTAVAVLGGISPDSSKYPSASTAQV